MTVISRISGQMDIGFAGDGFVGKIFNRRGAEKRESLES
jgi:hypothetical protein